MRGILQVEISISWLISCLVHSCDTEGIPGIIMRVWDRAAGSCQAESGQLSLIVEV